MSHDDTIDVRERGQRFGQVKLQFDMEAWLNTSVGLYLVERAKHEEAEAMQELATVNPEDTKAIRALQQRIAVVNAWQGWISDAIIEGRHAQQELIAQDSA